MYHILYKALFQHVHITCTKAISTHLLRVFRLYDLNRNKVEEFPIFWSLSGVLEVKYDLDIKIDEICKNACINWNVVMDVLPGSAMLVPYSWKYWQELNLAVGP